MMGEYVLYYGGKVVGASMITDYSLRLLKVTKNKICKNLYLMMVQNICI